MEFAKVTAIIRNEVVKNVELALEKAGVSGFTVLRCKAWASGKGNSPSSLGRPRISR